MLQLDANAVAVRSILMEQTDGLSGWPQEWVLHTRLEGSKFISINSQDAQRRFLNHDHIQVLHGAGELIGKNRYAAGQQYATGGSLAG